MLRIITVEERLARPPTVNIALFGGFGVGKTTQARTLNPNTTLFADAESGLLAVQDWDGDVIDMHADAARLGLHPWEMSQAIACLLSGPDPADIDGPYSAKAYAWYAENILPPESLAKYDTAFVDSITVVSRWCFEWAKRQPQALSEKTGKPDTRSAYGLLGNAMVRWLTVLQHAPKSVIVVGILDRVVDDFKRVTWEPQIEGGKTARELPGIFDQVVTLEEIDFGEYGKSRAFVCTKDNPYGFPAKDRSGRLKTLEAPDLGALIHKMRTGPRLDGTLNTSLPVAPKSAEGAA